MNFFHKHPALRQLLLVSMLASASALVPAAAVSTTSDAHTSGSYTHQTAPTQYIDVDGAHMAYRRFGKRGGIPLVFFQHFVGNLDSWDPEIVDGFARNREVILFDNAGVGDSGGDVPTTIEAMAKQSIDFLHALKVTKADLFGFSMGSLVAQEVTIEQPDLVHRVILAGSSARGGVGMASLTPEFQAMLSKKRAVPDELLLDVFFTPSAKSQAAGRAFLTRVRARKIDRDAEPNAKVAPAQAAAIAGWGAPHADAFAYLKAIKQPVLVVDGSNDLIFYTINSFNLQQHLSDAELIIFPDSAHGSMYQYPDRFLKNASDFLSNPTKV